jgi:hypothetical protein
MDLLPLATQRGGGRLAGQPVTKYLCGVAGPSGRYGRKALTIPLFGRDYLAVGVIRFRAYRALERIVGAPG